MSKRSLSPSVSPKTKKKAKGSSLLLKDFLSNNSKHEHLNKKWATIVQVIRQREQALRERGHIDYHQGLTIKKFYVGEILMSYFVVPFFSRDVFERYQYLWGMNASQLWKLPSFRAWWCDTAEEEDKDDQGAFQTYLDERPISPELFDLLLPHLSTPFLEIIGNPTDIENDNVKFNRLSLRDEGEAHHSLADVLEDIVKKVEHIDSYDILSMATGDRLYHGSTFKLKTL